MKYQGNRKHVDAVRKLMEPELTAGRIRVTATTVTFLPPSGNAVALIEGALDRAHPAWRDNPLEHLSNFPSPRPPYLLLLQVRSVMCRESNTDPKKV